MKVIFPFKGPNFFFDIRHSNFKIFLHRYFFYENRKNFTHFESFPVFTPDSFLADVSITILMSMLKLSRVVGLNPKNLKMSIEFTTFLIYFKVTFRVVVEVRDVLIIIHKVRQGGWGGQDITCRTIRTLPK